MAEKIKGTDVILKLNILGTYEAYCHATAVTFNHEVEMNPVRTEGDGGGTWGKFRPKRQTYSISFDGLSLIDETGDKVTTFDMLNQMMGFIATPYFLIFTGENGTVITVYGRVFFQAATLNITPANFVNKNITMQGSGAYTFSPADESVPTITIQTTGDGTGAITTLILRDPSTLQEWSFVGSIPNGSTETWVLDGTGGNPPGGTYFIDAVVESEEDENTFSTDASPTASQAVGSGSTIIGTGGTEAPFGNNVQFDFTEDRTITFNLQGVNDPPVADAGDDQTIELPTSSVVLDGSGSTDDGTIVTYLWEVVSGPASWTIVTGAFPVTLVTGLIEGTYVFRLTVTDDGGLTDTDEVTITVDPDPSPGPAVTIEVTGVGTGTTGYVQLVDPTTLAYWTSPTFNMTPGTTLVWPLNGVGSNPPPGTYWIAGYVTANASPSRMITNAPPTANELMNPSGQSLLSLTHPTAFDFTTSRTITFLLGS